MRKTISLLFLLLLSTYTVVAQTEMSGTVYDEYLEVFPNATIKINSKKVTTSDIDGLFTINIKRKFPVTVEVSAIGYGTETLEISSSNDELYFVLKETGALEQVVVSASRTPERILESPVTVERIGFKDIRKNASFNIYDGLENLKAVDVNVSSLGFKSINTRGFAGFENVRFVQLVDGMDNMIPSLNYTMGNMAGIPDIDIESIEILPGAASALYGANAFNGILLMNTKSPFDHQGITVQLGSGITNQKLAGSNPFYDTSIRMGYAFNDKFATKVTFSHYKSEEWHAEDTRDIVNGLIGKGTRETDPHYNGVNVYGDETTIRFNDIASKDSAYDRYTNFSRKVIDYFKDDAEKATALIDKILDSDLNRTGYLESALVSNRSKKVNFSGSLHFRPFSNNKLELIFNSKYNLWDNVYQGKSRFAQKDFYTQLHKLEIKGHDFFARAYYSQNDAGNSYDLSRTARYINNTWKKNDLWYDQDFLNGFLENYNLSTNNLTESFNLGRLKADTNAFKPGTSQFNNAFNKITSDSNPKTGSKLKDETSFYHGDIQFNLQNYIDWAEIIVGSSYRFYKLKSFGTIFNDKGGHIRYDEQGTYLQLQKSLFEKRLRLTGSIRYDKSTNYEGNYSPRVAVTYAAGKNRGHNIRASFQTAFRNPTAQEQYIGLQVSPHNYVLGSTLKNVNNYSIKYKNRIGDSRELFGEDIYKRGLIPSSVRKFLKSGSFGSRNYSLIKVAQYEPVRPEQLKSLELGYRGLLTIKENILNIDFNTYYNTYTDLITEKEVWVADFTRGDLEEKIKNETNPTKERIQELVLEDFANGIDSYGDYESYKIKTNSKAKVDSWGAAIALNTKIFNNFEIGANYSYTDFSYDEKEDTDFKPNFNTSKHKVKLQLGNKNLFKNFGFNAQARWQDKYYWQSPFISGEIPARTLVDAQINYRIPSLKSTFKLGGTNLLGKEYFSAPGVGAIGSVYYLNWIIND